MGEYAGLGRDLIPLDDVGKHLDQIDAHTDVVGGGIDAYHCVATRVEQAVGDDGQYPFGIVGGVIGLQSDGQMPW